MRRPRDESHAVREPGAPQHKDPVRLRDALEHHVSDGSGLGDAELAELTVVTGGALSLIAIGTGTSSYALMTLNESTTRGGGTRRRARA